MDFQLINHFTLVQFVMLTDQARDWADTHIPPEAFLGSSFVAEARYAEPIVAGIIDAGLLLE